MKQEVQTECVAMLRDHVTEEDTETFARVQELAAQVRKQGEKVKPGGGGYYQENSWLMQ